MNSPNHLTQSGARYAETLNSILSKDYRILVNGATGWLGSNISETLINVFGFNFQKNLMLTGSRNSILKLQHGAQIQVNKWSKHLVEEFNPTHVVQLAFKTRDHVSEMTLSDYLQVNEQIIDHALWMTSLPSLEGFLHTSSGAALGLNANNKNSDPYGYLKKLEELEYADSCNRHGKNYLGLRVWSTTGRYIKTGGVFAIESLISQAISTKTIRINSPGKVIRSYADANEIMVGGVLGLLTEEQGVFNSGGTEVELGQLAAFVAELSPNKGVEIVRSPATAETPNIYRSINPSIEQVLNDRGLRYSSMKQQVVNTMRYLISQKHTIPQRTDFKD